MNRPITLLYVPLALYFSMLAAASPVTYNVTVNTSSIAGTAGSLDFNFNPGPLTTQSASLQILSFAGDGALAGSPTLTGDVIGTLPSAVTLANGSAFNDYFSSYTFGSTLSFQVTLSGPALSAPNGTATSGSSFAFSMFSNAAGTIPTLTSDFTDGFALTVNVNLDGTTSVTSFSPQTSVMTAATGAPEPASLTLLIASLICLSAMTLRRRGPVHLSRRPE